VSKKKKLTSKDYYKLADEIVNNNPIAAARFIHKGLKKEKEEMWKAIERSISFNKRKRKMEATNGQKK
jgi:transcriptional antiterminator